jgi:hypothetical protein
MNNNFLTETEEIEERLVVLKNLIITQDIINSRRAEGEIKYLEGILRAAEFSTFNDYQAL